MRKLGVNNAVGYSNSTMSHDASAGSAANSAGKSRHEVFLSAGRAMTARRACIQYALSPEDRLVYGVKALLLERGIQLPSNTLRPLAVTTNSVCWGVWVYDGSETRRH